MSQKPINRRFKVLLLKDKTHRLEWVTDSLHTSDCDVVHFSGSLLQMESAILKEAPDIIMIDTESPNRDTLEHICLYSQVCHKPVVVFTEDQDTEKLRKAVRAGVAAYVVSGLSAERVRPILEAAVTRHEIQTEMMRELNAAKTSLKDQKLIEKAKRLLIKQGKSEDEAYKTLRSLAMYNGNTIAEIARQILLKAG